MKDGPGVALVRDLRALERSSKAHGLRKAELCPRTMITDHLTKVWAVALPRRPELLLLRCGR
jgi:hypothetical protein